MKRSVPVLIFLMILAASSAESIELRPITLAQKLEDSVYFEVVNVSEHVISFRPYFVDGIEFLTLHKYMVAASSAGPGEERKPICTNLPVAVGTKLILIRERSPLPNTVAEITDAVKEQCGALNRYFEAAFGYEVLKVEDVYHDSRLREFVVLPYEAYRVSGNQKDYLERSHRTMAPNGEVVLETREVLVPLKSVDEIGKRK